MTIEEYNRLATDIALRIGQHIIAGGSCDDEYVKTLRQRAEKLYKVYWSDKNETKNY